MPTENKCLICSSSDVATKETILSGFMAQRIFDGKNKSVKLIYCRNCGFAYYDFRPDEEQMKKLYAGYRDENYQKQRQEFDCWYTKELNEAIGKNPLELKNRSDNTARIFSQNLDVEEIKTVLDFGGDKGQYIPSVFDSCKRLVYDISGAEPCEGVDSIDNWKDLASKKFDLIMCNHVIEHLSAPVDTINKIKQLSNKGSYLYLELPFDSPFYKNALSNFSFLFNKYFSLGVILKHFINLVKNRAFAPMSEHINFFTPKSAQILLEKNGYELLSNEVVNIDIGWNKIKFICILAKKLED